LQISFRKWTADYTARLRKETGKNKVYKSFSANCLVSFLQENPALLGLCSNCNNNSSRSFIDTMICETIHGKGLLIYSPYNPTLLELFLHAQWK